MTAAATADTDCCHRTDMTPDMARTLIRIMAMHHPDDICLNDVVVSTIAHHGSEFIPAISGVHASAAISAT